MNQTTDPLRAALRENETVVLEIYASTHVGFFAGIHTRPEEVRMLLTSARLLMGHGHKRMSHVSWGDVQSHGIKANGRVTLQYRDGTVEVYDFPTEPLDEVERILPLLRAGGESTTHAGRAWLCVRCDAPLERLTAECASCKRRYVTPRAVLEKSWIPAGGLFLLGRTGTAAVIVLIQLLTLYGAWNVFSKALELGSENMSSVLWLGAAVIALEQFIATLAAYRGAKRIPHPLGEGQRNPRIVTVNPQPRLPIRNAAASQPAPAARRAQTATPVPRPPAPNPVVPRPAPPPPLPSPSQTATAPRLVRPVNPHEHVVGGTFAWTLVGAIGVILFFGFLLIGTWGIGLLLMLLSIWTIERKVNGILLGGAVRVGPYQFPEIHQRVLAIAAAMGVDRTPEVFVLESNTQNAFAMKHGKKSRIVLIDDLVFGSALTGNENVLTWILAHEIAHISLGHTDFFRGWMRGVIPPLSRLDEFTCDRVATAAVNDPDAVRDALTLLLVGPQLFSRVNHRALQQQANELMTTQKGARKYGESRASHPLLLHRYAKLVELLPPLPRVTRPATSPGATLAT